MDGGHLASVEVSMLYEESYCSGSRAATLSPSVRSAMLDKEVSGRLPGKCTFAYHDLSDSKYTAWPADLRNSNDP